MYEYLAATCARAGDLLLALSGDQADRELLTTAGEIIRSLIIGGPAEGIDDYEDARPVIESFLGYMDSAAETIEDFVHVNSIKTFMDGGEDQWAIRLEKGWTEESRSRLRAMCASILDRPEWPDRVRAGFESLDEVKFYHADQAAHGLGIDTWDVHWRRLRQKPTDPGRWSQVMSRCDEGRIGEVVTLATEHLDLKAIATGAADELGLGPAFGPHSCLGFILQDLRRFPGRGPEFVAAGLNSPVVSNRNLAVNALAAWPRGTWPSKLTGSLEMAAENEPNDRVRERLRRLLKGEPLS
jgi:hypothetical protein